MAGAIAFFVYAAAVSWLMMRYEIQALWATIFALPLWLGVAFATWSLWLR